MHDTITHNGAMFRVSLEPDTDHGAPWDEENGHGPVSDWRRGPNYTGHHDKRPGEILLCGDRHAARFYDFAEEKLFYCQIVLRS